jgi:hypothetical protein
MYFTDYGENNGVDHMNIRRIVNYDFKFPVRRL